MKVITIIVPSNQCHLLIKELEADYFIFKKFTSSENNFISQFEYLGQVSSLYFEDKFYERK